MRDLAVILILSACFWIAWRRPWLGVLGLSMVGYMAPQGYAVAGMKSFPAYLFIFVGLVAGVVRAWTRGEVRLRLPLDWRLWALLALWAWFVLTTVYSLAAFAAWPRLFEVSKSLLPLLFTLLLIDHRNKLFLLLVAITLSFALITLKGAYWAVLNGFSDRIYGPPGGHFYDNNLFAVAVVMTLPLLMLWWHEARRPELRFVVLTLIALSVAAVLSSWSRGALVTLGVTLSVLLWDAQKRYMALLLLLLGGAAAVVVMPESWFDRMGTVLAYHGEASAESRLDVWKTGLTSMLSHPLTGSGFEGWQHVTRGVIDWHNSYVEVLAEHGPIGLVLWLGLLLGTLVSLGRQASVCDRSPHLTWAGNYSRALRASLVAYAAGSLFIGVSYWDLYFHLVTISVVLASLIRRSQLEVPIKAANAGTWQS